jgi:Mrp family chromosome partitioning ATPase
MSIVEKAIDRMKSRAPEARQAEEAGERAVVDVRAERRAVPAPVELTMAAAAEPQAEAETLRHRRQEGDVAGFSPELSRIGQLRTQLRGLRRRVLDATQAVRESGRAPVVVVTSAAPGEGKSFMAFHLAMSMTVEPDIAPVLLDADLVRQQATRLFSTAASGGLAASLERGQPLGDAVCHTDIPNLCMVPAGSCSQSAIEYLGGTRWNRLVAEMHAAGPRRIFIIDTPPVLATTEAQYLARSADVVLFVVRSEVSLQQSVSESLTRLGPGANVAFVFNGRVSTGSDVYYGYSYYGDGDGNE